MIIAAADGSSLANPGPAGWAWYIDEEHWAAGGWAMGTNNMGELQAVLDLLESTAISADQPIRILCDSQYVINSLTKWLPGWKRKGWKKADGKPVLNQDLLMRLDKAMDQREITFEWVKGHSGHPLNEAADKRARAAATAYRDGLAVERGPGFTPGAAARDQNGGPGLLAASGSGSGETGKNAPASPDNWVAELFNVDDPSLFEAPPAEPAVKKPQARLTGDTEELTGQAHLVPAEFTEPPAFEGEAEVGDKDLLEIAEQEKALLSPQVRADKSQYRKYLHPEFCEFGSTGRVRNRSRAVVDVRPFDVRVRYEPIGADRLGSDLVLLRWRAVAAKTKWLRSSLWQRVAGRWLLRFTQATKITESC